MYRRNSYTHTEIQQKKDWRLHQSQKQARDKCNGQFYINTAVDIILFKFDKVRSIHVWNILTFVKAVCGPDNLITYASVRWPGAVNDARVFRNCGLRDKLESGINLNNLLRNSKLITSPRVEICSKVIWQNQIEVI